MWEVWRGSVLIAIVDREEVMLRFKNANAGYTIIRIE